MDARLEEDEQDLVTYKAETATKAELDTVNQNIDFLDTDKADIVYVDTITSSIASGSPKGAYETLAVLETAYPTGNTGIYVITTDGNWYYWSGSAWTSGGVYQSTLWQNALTTQNANWSVI